MSTTPKSNRTTHTPGPWGVSSLFVVVDQDAHILANCMHTGVPVLDVPFDERVANARLMAAAPALLEACKDLVDRFDRKATSKASLSCSYMEAKAAIAKAEGR